MKDKVLASPLELDPFASELPRLHDALSRVPSPFGPARPPGDIRHRPT